MSRGRWESCGALPSGAQSIRLSSSAGAACDTVLLPGRAAFLPTRRTLLVADLHLGKSATFRRAGLPVPEGSSAGDLARLAGLTAALAASRVIVLGDLFHAASGCTPAVFDEWRRFRERVAADVLLVPGNHDRRLQFPSDLGIEITGGPMVEDGCVFRHEPPDALTECVAFCGHLHPRLAIRSPAGDRCSDRCFVGRPGLLVLPAFATFAGASVVRADPGTRLWAAGMEAVVEVTRMAMLASRRSPTTIGQRPGRRVTRGKGEDGSSP